ncbi:MAG: hypothetical protein QNJ60_12145 [Xenococcaceae cyanobacterium MO_188.B19]|nr:hypothetical protein [Xenococcaceae cyanobacterium MO_188.B19]
MLSQINYLIRSQKDGKYLVARIEDEDSNKMTSYLLVFKEDYEALSYINTHGKSMSSELNVESTSATALKGILQRWGYQGIGYVEDPLIPQIKFMILT